MALAQTEKYTTIYKYLNTYAENNSISGSTINTNSCLLGTNNTKFNK